MSFLYPLLGLGALSLAVPIWLHLRAKSGPVRPFTALQFLEDQPRPKSRGFRLRDLVLFTLRGLALLLLVAGFAWPYRPGRAGGGITESRVFVLDNTLSQQVDGAFAEDLREVQRRIAGSGAHTQNAVVELTGRARVVAGFADGRDETLRKLAALHPSHQRGPYLDAFRLAESLLEQSLGERRRIVFFGDGQENQWTENETSPSFLKNVEVELARKPAHKSRPNLSLADPEARLFFVGERTLVDFAVQLRHDGSAREVPLRLLANGQTVLKQVVKLEADRTTSTLHAEWPVDPARWLQGEVLLDRGEGGSDALPPDDRVYFCLPPVREGRIALLARSPYLRAALAPETMKGRWATEPVDVTRAGFADAPESSLADVLVLESDYAQSEQVRTLAFRYLNNGRGVILFLGRTTPLLAGFLQELGLRADAVREGAEGLRYVAVDHPIFKPFVRGDLGDLTEPRILRHLALRANEGNPLAFGAKGDALLFEGNRTRGRLLVFGFGMDRTQTDWPLLPSFIPFLDLSLQHARSSTPLQTGVIAGDLFVHDAPPGRTPKELRLRDGTREIARVRFDTQRRARIQAPDRPGFYGLTYDDDETLAAMIAVNPPPRESDLTYRAEPIALQAWTVPAEAARRAEALDGAAGQRALLLLARDQRLWWWLLLAAAAALLAESVSLLRRREHA